VRGRADPGVVKKVTRHRHGPGGDRQANHALWRIVVTRMGSDPATRAYAERRTKEGKSKAEIIRAGHRLRLLESDGAPARTTWRAVAGPPGA
jgi:hypothetical protein